MELESCRLIHPVFFPHFSGYLALFFTFSQIFYCSKKQEWAECGVFFFFFCLLRKLITIAKANTCVDTANWLIPLRAIHLKLKGWWVGLLSSNSIQKSTDWQAGERCPLASQLPSFLWPPNHYHHQPHCADTVKHDKAAGGRRL